MSQLVFKLKSVSEAEANGVREVLEQNNIEFYETPGGMFGWSIAGIWVKQDNDFEAARSAIEKFQEEYLQAVRENTNSDSRINPKKLILLIILVAIVIYLFNSFWIHQLLKN